MSHQLCRPTPRLKRRCRRQFLKRHNKGVFGNQKLLNSRLMAFSSLQFVRVVPHYATRIGEKISISLIEIVSEIACLQTGKNRKALKRLGFGITRLINRNAIINVDRQRRSAANKGVPSAKEPNSKDRITIIIIMLRTSRGILKS